jgi:hypothetical protein
LFFDLFAILALAALTRLVFFSEALGTDEIVYLTRAQHNDPVMGGKEALNPTRRWRKADSNSWSHLWMRVSLGETGRK